LEKKAEESAKGGWALALKENVQFIAVGALSVGIVAAHIYMGNIKVSVRLLTLY